MAQVSNLCKPCPHSLKSCATSFPETEMHPIRPGLLAWILAAVYNSNRKGMPMVLFGGKSKSARGDGGITRPATALVLPFAWDSGGVTDIA